MSTTSSTTQTVIPQRRLLDARRVCDRRDRDCWTWNSMIRRRLASPVMSVARRLVCLHCLSVGHVLFDGSECLPRNASRSLKPLLPWSKLLCVMTSHLVSSDSICSPPEPKNLMYISSSFLGSLLTSCRPPGIRFMRAGTGAFSAGGVCDHRGGPCVSTSISDR